MSTVSVAKLTVELLNGNAVVEEVSFEIDAGRVLGLVGESGCGKTTAALALLAYARPGSRISAGKVEIDGADLLSVDKRELQRLRGGRVAYVPQDPASALNPAIRVGSQIGEMLATHAAGQSNPDALILEALRRVHLEPPEQFVNRYPHQLSGGQQQRVAIAMALICGPSLVVLDEPTTGLDVTTQARVLELIDEIRAERSTALLYVSHDLGVVSHFADSVAVMYGGRIVEQGNTDAVFASPRHPYTSKLLAAVPRSDVSGQHPHGIEGTAVGPSRRRAGCSFAPRCDLRTTICTSEVPPLAKAGDGRLVACFNWDMLPSGLPSQRSNRKFRGLTRDEDSPRLFVEDLRASYGRSESTGEALTPALDGVSLTVAQGECLAIVGESGSGKTTIARCIVGIWPPDSGRILLDGREVARRARHRTKQQRREMQIVFQNPDESLNPKHTVEQIVARPLVQFFDLSGREARKEARKTLELVRLEAPLAYRYPKDLSGGEKQRVAIARALAARPELLICDEITSALDVSVQAAILELIADLRKSLEMAIIFISHDLAVVRSIADRIVVLERGRICETGETDHLFDHQEADYTRALITAQKAWSLETSANASDG